MNRTAKRRSPSRSFLWGVVLIGSVSVNLLFGQGTVTFNSHPYFANTNYVELGMRFQVVVPAGASSYDVMGIVPGNFYINLPANDSAFMYFLRQNNPYDDVSLCLTNGSLFGLSSVWLADPTSPSPSPVSISFVGCLFGGSTVTNTFATPGNGATTFASYMFDSAFASGLSRVDILAPRWATDNLVFSVPEPSAVALMILGVLALALRRRRGHASRVKITQLKREAGENWLKAR